MILLALGHLYFQGRLIRPSEKAPAAPPAPYGLLENDGGAVRLNINAADEAALMQISGIGEALSSLIVAARVENGPYASVDDLKNLSGIGEAKLEAIRPYICCGQEGVTWTYPESD